jgi:hypothetical protein
MPHATAAQVRSLMGEGIWRSYFKFTIERNPWDRLIPLWRWRQSHRNTTIPLQAFLDRVILYDHLEAGLAEALAQVEMVYDGGLPRAKAGIRLSNDTTETLTAGQYAMIADLARNEIGAFGFSV